MPPCSAPLLPARGEKVGMRGRGRAFRLAVLRIAERPPHPRFARPLPAPRGEVNKRKRSRDASAPSHANKVMPTTTRKKKDRGRRSAERRMPSIVRATIGNIAVADIATDARQTVRARLPALRRGLATPVAPKPSNALPEKHAILLALWRQGRKCDNRVEANQSVRQSSPACKRLQAIALDNHNQNIDRSRRDTPRPTRPECRQAQ